MSLGSSAGARRPCVWILHLVAGTVVTIFGLALVAFGVTSFVRPEPTHRFLRLFASSARAHYTEQALGVYVLYGVTGAWS